MGQTLGLEPCQMNGDKVRNCCPITLAQNQEAVGSDWRFNIEPMDTWRSKCNWHGESRQHNSDCAPLESGTFPPIGNSFVDSTCEELNE